MMEIQLIVEPPFSANPTSDGSGDIDWPSITQQIADGDRQAFAIYYQSFFDVMFREVKRVSDLDESSCLDIVQDSMLKVIGAIKRIENEKILAGWSRAVARNSTYDWLKKNRRSVSNLDVVNSQPTTDNEEDDLLELQARMIWIEEQILKQPAEIQRLFSLRYRFGWTLKKIAMSLGSKTGAIHGKLRRAVDNIKAAAERIDQDFEG